MKYPGILRVGVIVSIFLLSIMIFQVYAAIPGPEPSVSPLPTPTPPPPTSALPSLPPFYFTLQLTPPTATVEQGQTANYIIQITYSHPLYYGTIVTFQIAALDSSMQYQLSTSGNLAITTSPSTPPETYSITLIGSAMGLVQQTSGTLTVTAKPLPFDYSVTVMPSTQTIMLGNASTYVVVVSLGSGAGEPVSLSLSGLPTDIQHSFSTPSGIPTYSSTLTIDTSASTSPGNYVFEVVAIGGGRTEVATATLNVVKPTISPQGTLTASPKVDNASRESNIINETPATEDQPKVEREEVFARVDLINKLSMGAIFTALLTLLIQSYEKRRDNKMSMKIAAAQKLEAALNASEEKAEEIEEERKAAWTTSGEVVFIVEVLTIVFILLILVLSI